MLNRHLITILGILLLCGAAHAQRQVICELTESEPYKLECTYRVEGTPAYILTLPDDHVWVKYFGNLRPGISTVHLTEFRNRICLASVEGMGGWARHSQGSDFNVCVKKKKGKI